MLKNDKMDINFSLLNKNEINEFYSELECISFGPSYCYYPKLFDLCTKYHLYFLRNPDNSIIISDDPYYLE